MRFADANFKYTEQPERWLTYDDVLLLPQESRISSRNSKEISLSTHLTDSIKIDNPIISANMDTVTGADMAIKMAENGCYGILHRFHHTEEDFWQDFDKLVEQVNIPAISIGLDHNKYFTLIKKILDKKYQNLRKLVVCIDVANGHMTQVPHTVRLLRQHFGEDIDIIAGSVATPEGIASLVNAGVSACRVGIGNGSRCTTRLQTGFGVPQLSAIILARRTLSGMQSNVRLIADGGIKYAGDVLKALAAGANTVMLGNMLSGTIETPGQLYYRSMLTECGEYIEAHENDAFCNQQLYKKYRGQASQDFMNDMGKTGVSAEGVSNYVPLKGSVTDIINHILGGIRSGMSYCGSRTLSELHQKAIFIEVSQSTHIENLPHGLFM